MNGQQITLKTVSELRTDETDQVLHFFVPDYQRGFRWDPLQVTQLLDDIREFTHRRNPQPKEFYCLQPLVVKTRHDGRFEVVDGQQRLTTILLILRHFNERLTERFRKPVFTLEYETRPLLDKFLAEPSKTESEDNGDYFHIYNALQAIESWFEQHDSEVEAIKTALLNDTKVIWFQLDEHDNAVSAFTRLNVGKIPLTNDELIRALFLRRKGPDDKDSASLQLRIAYEWDQMEKALQSDAFWCFLSNDHERKQNRIGFLFELMADSHGYTTISRNDSYSIFYEFNKRLNAAGVKLDEEWLKVKNTYQMLEEWYGDRRLFHMIGYLVNEGVTLNAIWKLSKDSLKSHFEVHLRNEIFRRTIGEQLTNPPDEQLIRTQIAERLAEISYSKRSDSHIIRSILLLFNIATLLQNRKSNMRFQFECFKTENWDIEHIRSVGDDKPRRADKRNSWLDNCLGYLNLQIPGDDSVDEIKKYIAHYHDYATEEFFDIVYEKVLEYFHEDVDGEAEHVIENLTLLDEHTNRSYKNAVFAVKRKRILDLDRDGIFVPLCTRNVFLKCYSPQVDNVMFWSDSDRNGYREAILETLVNIFCEKVEGNQ